MVKRDVPVEEAYIEGYRTAQRDCLIVIAKWFPIHSPNGAACQAEIRMLPAPAQMPVVYVNENPNIK